MDGFDSAMKGFFLAMLFLVGLLGVFLIFTPAPKRIPTVADMAQPEAQTGSVYKVSGKSLTTEYIQTVTDTETGQQYILVTTYPTGVSITPKLPAKKD